MTNVTIRTLEVYLRRFGWSRYKVIQEEGEKQGMILTGWEGLGRQHVMAIDPIEEKNVLIFQVPQILSAPPESTPSNRLQELLIAIGKINYQIILGKFSYDPRDGEVRFSLAIPTDKSNLTYEQFKHCMEVTTFTVERYQPLLEKILRGEKTHRDIGETEVLTELLQRLLDRLP